MSIDNINTYYSGGYYNLSQSEANYLNYETNTTVGSVSTEFLDVASVNNLPTWSNKITVYTNSTGSSAGSVNLTNSTLNIENDTQQFLTIINNTGFILPITYKTETINLIDGSGVNLTYANGIIFPVGGTAGSIDLATTEYGQYIYSNGTNWVVGTNEIKIGAGAGQTGQGTGSIAIGSGAGNAGQRSALFRMLYKSYFGAY